MPLAFVLGFSDFLVILLLVMLVIGRRAVSQPRYDDPAQLDRIEYQLDVLMAALRIDLSEGDELLDTMDDEEEEHPGIAPFRAYPSDSGKETWQEIADDPAGSKVSAIKAYRDQHGVSLTRAKRIVEAYMRRSKPRG